MPAGLAHAVHLVLRGPDSPAAPRANLSLLLLLIILCGAIYGAAMGSYRGLTDGQTAPILYSAIKLPIFLLGTLVLTLPSFLVLNSVSGFRAQAPQVVRALLEQQAALAVILASFAPLTLFWYFSGLRYHGAVLLNLGAVIVACVASHRVLHRAYRPLLMADSRHYLLMLFWQILFAFVAIQMAWILRPFVGVPNSPVVFLRQHDFNNAYDMIVTTVWRAINR